MPAISNFLGITIRMQSEKGGKHHKPHIHAIYGDCEIVMALDCETLEVFFSKKQLTLLKVLVSIHEDELMENWKLLESGKGYFKIEPLR